MKQPYSLKEIDESEFNTKVDNMVEAIENVKNIIWCDDTVEECTDECPLKIVCKEIAHITMWGMLRKILPDKK